jgi:hypothetical protein
MPNTFWLTILRCPNSQVILMLYNPGVGRDCRSNQAQFMSCTCILPLTVNIQFLLNATSDEKPAVQHDK